MKLSTGIAAVAAAIAALAIAGPAAAGTAKLQHTYFQNGTLSLVTATYVAAPGEANEAALTVEVTPAGTVIRVADSGAPVQAGRGFVSVTSGEAVATVTEEPPNGFIVTLSLGDRSDRGVVDLPDSPPFYGGAFLKGGSGHDQLVVGPRHASGHATLLGGPGSDLLDGGSAGGTASYVDHRLPVRVDFDGVDDDGSVGERDRLRNITSVVGGPRNDVLIGGASAETLLGRAGSDTIRGGGGNDVLYGEWGADRIAGGSGEDRIEGGDGNDVLWARDGLRDLVYGRGGIDRAALDAVDAARGIERRF